MPGAFGDQLPGKLSLEPPELIERGLVNVEVGQTASKRALIKSATQKMLTFL